MNARNFNIICISLILIWIGADRFFHIGSPAYGWLIFVYVSVLFCGSYFIRWGFFMKSVNRMVTTEKVLALTFDDGPSGNQTTRILDILREYQAEAAFFCIGKNMQGNETLLKRMVSEGHIIGNHSFSHHALFDLYSSGRMQQELEETSRLCQSITGNYPRFFRPPYGVTNPNLKNAVDRAGFISIGWSVRSLDTVIRQDDRLRNRILKAVKPGAIVLLHDTSETTIRILPALLTTWREQGYQITRLDKMMNTMPYA